jgi:hypothetical protein
MTSSTALILASLILVAAGVSGITRSVHIERRHGWSLAASNPEHEQERSASHVMRLRGGVMWIGGGKNFNRTADPTATPEAQEDTFHPLRQRLANANRSC